MIVNATEYQKAEEELRSLEVRLMRLRQTGPAGFKGFTKAGVRKMIARLHEELAAYEGGEEARGDPNPNERGVVREKPFAFGCAAACAAAGVVTWMKHLPCVTVYSILLRPRPASC